MLVGAVLATGGVALSGDPAIVTNGNFEAGALSTFTIRILNNALERVSSTLLVSTVPTQFTLEY